VPVLGGVLGAVMGGALAAAIRRWRSAEPTPKSSAGAGVPGRRTGRPWPDRFRWILLGGRNGTGGSYPDDPRLSTLRVLCLLALFATGLALPLPAATSSALLAVGALLPGWASVLPRYRGATLVAGLAAIGLLFGVLLAWMSAVDHAFALREALQTAFLIAAGIGCIGLVLWARTLLPVSAIGVAFGLGLLARGVLNASESDNAIKFQLALPIAIIALSLLAGRRRPVLTAVVLLGLGGLNILNDARSAFGFCVIAAALVLWQARPTPVGRRTHPVLGVALLAVLGLGAYTVVSELLVSGALGREVQSRTVTQINQSGSLLLGGRPEWSATWQLFQESPLGNGLGTIPNVADVQAAREGFAITNIPTAEGYIENYLFDGRFELHSIVADLWSNLGPFGVALGLAMGVLIAAGLADRLRRRTASGLVCLLALTSLWFLAFGTVWSNLLQVTFTVGLLLPLATRGSLPSGPRAAPEAEESPSVPPGDAPQWERDSRAGDLRYS
jgi:hypothetical protein